MPFGWDDIPFVGSCLIAMAVSFLLFFFLAGLRPTMIDFMAVVARPGDPAGQFSRIWTVFTYPFIQTDFIRLLLLGLWLYQIGGSLERSWGSRNFPVVFFALTGIGGVSALLVGHLLGRSVGLVGMILPLAAITAAWAALDPEMRISFWGFITMSAKVLALVYVLWVYFDFGFAYGPLAALFVFVPVAAAVFYVRKMPRLNLSSPSLGRPQAAARRKTAGPPGERVYRADAPKTRQEKAEIERLRKLLGDDEDDRGTTATRH